VDRADPKETIMLAICIRLAAAIHGYLAFYMPTNRVVDWLRSPSGIKWAIPVAILATPGYLFAMSVCMTIIERGGPGYLNVLVMLFAWNAMKFVMLGALSPLLLYRLFVFHHRRCDQSSRYQRGPASVSDVGVTPALADRPHRRCALFPQLHQPAFGQNDMREGHDNQVRAS
jgi:hypothetical protein